MGKYTIQEHWPEDLRVLASNVIRAKLERQWRKNNVLTCDSTQELRYCVDRYMEADRAVRRAKANFQTVFEHYRNLNVV